MVVDVDVVVDVNVVGDVDVDVVVDVDVDVVDVVDNSSGSTGLLKMSPEVFMLFNPSGRRQQLPK